MPAVRDILFSEAISQGSVGGVTYHTTLISAAGGWEQRIANWDLGRLQWDISKLLKDRDVLAYVIAFFRTMKGRGYGFLFKDWSDYSVGMTWVSDVLTFSSYIQTGTGDAADTTFQLYRTYFGDPIVHVANVVQATSAYTATVWNGTGTVVFGVAPASGAAVLFMGIASNETADGIITSFTFTDVPTEARKITRPKRGGVRIYLDGTLKTEVTHYTIDYTTGIVTFLSAPGNNVKVQWAGEFYVPVRFDSDLQKVMIEGYGKGEWNRFMVVEVRE